MKPRGFPRPLEKVQQSFQNAETLQAHAVRELQDAFLDSREPGWDGYGANAVPDEAFLRAKTFLDHVLKRFPSPTAAATPNGSLAFEWAPVKIGYEFHPEFREQKSHRRSAFVMDATLLANESSPRAS
jgi:hypothetical protein